jgi:CRP/FNR family transcriptional regulator, cyclic AMP receptor protein
MMNDNFDFTDDETPLLTGTAPTAKSPLYDAALARELFEAASTPESFAVGQVIFAENDAPAKSGFFSKAAPSRMYFIVQGEISLTTNGRVLDVLRAGEIFGEMTVVTGAPRSATATAKTAATLLSLDASQLPAALQKASPSFGLMLMSVMFDRLRLVAARLSARKVTSGRLVGREAEVFDSAMLARLQKELERPAILHFPEGKTIMKQGEVGVTMYIVLEGRVGIYIGENRVETITTGGAFGEMALVSQAPRTASASAREDCTLLSINRQTMIELVQTNPDFGIAILRAVAERLRFMNGLLR